MTVPAEPDLSGRLLHLTVIRTMAAKPELLFSGVGRTIRPLV
jgi:hypothetical protein